MASNILHTWTAAINIEYIEKYFKYMLLLYLLNLSIFETLCLLTEISHVINAINVTGYLFIHQLRLISNLDSKKERWTFNENRIGIPTMVLLYLDGGLLW